MGCGGSKEETEFKRDDGTDKRLVVGRVFTKPMLFKTFAAWQRFVVIRQAEKEEQRKLNDKIAEKEKVRKMTVMVAAPDEAKKKKPKAQAVSADLAASINSHVTKKENAKKDEKMEAEREKKERLAAAKKNMSPEDFRLMQERLIFEAAERDRKEQLPYGYFGSGGPVERGSMKPMWTGLLKRMVDKGYVEKAKFNIIDLLKPRKVAEPPAPAETGIWGGFGALQVWNSFMELGNAFSALGKTDTEEDLKKLFDEIGKRSCLPISPLYLLQAACPAIRAHAHERTAFDFFFALAAADEDGSGTLEIEELQKVFKEKLNIDKTDEEIKRIFEEVKGVGADLESVRRSRTCEPLSCTQSIGKPNSSWMLHCRSRRWTWQISGRLSNTSNPQIRGPLSQRRTLLLLRRLLPQRLLPKRLLRQHLLLLRRLLLWTLLIGLLQQRRHSLLQRRQLGRRPS